MCDCGKPTYFDMRTWRGFKSKRSQDIWHSSCAKHVSVKTWLPNEILKKSKQLLDEKNIFGDKIRQSMETPKVLSSLFKDTFDFVVTKYQQMCKGGNEFSQKDRMSLQVHFEHDLSTKYENHMKKVGNFNQYDLNKFFNRVKGIAKEIFDGLLYRLEQKTFDYCLCNTFFGNLQGRISNVLMSKGHVACRKKCPNWKMERKRRIKRMKKKKKEKLIKKEEKEKKKFFKKEEIEEELSIEKEDQKEEEEGDQEKVKKEFLENQLKEKKLLLLSIKREE